MKLIPSQKEALETARYALSEAQQNLLREMRSIQRIIDQASPTENVGWALDSMAKHKVRLGELLLTRERLWDLEMDGTEEAKE